MLPQSTIYHQVRFCLIPLSDKQTRLNTTTPSHLAFGLLEFPTLAQFPSAIPKSTPRALLSNDSVSHILPSHWQLIRKLLSCILRRRQYSVLSNQLLKFCRTEGLFKLQSLGVAEDPTTVRKG